MTESNRNYVDNLEDWSSALTFMSGMHADGNNGQKNKSFLFNYFRITIFFLNCYCFIAYFQAK